MSMNVTLVGTTILVRPDLSKAANPIEVTDLQSYSNWKERHNSSVSSEVVKIKEWHSNKCQLMTVQSEILIICSAKDKNLSYH
jgi:hypothetical protein